VREREWFELEDPAKKGATWRVDVTFLLSRWNCIYGRGCQGVLEKPQEVEGCCSFGAYFADDDDRKRVEAAAARLSPELWQHKSAGDRGIGKRKTRVVDGACVFLNREDFRGGMGCALHIGALAAGESPVDWKPDICWQLPLRYREEDNDVHIIEEFSQASWGEGGTTFCWWCTDAPEAFTARKPVFLTLETELRRIMGDGAYEALARYLTRRRRVPVVVHPAQR
jgi:hypothetical protein